MTHAGGSQVQSQRRAQPSRADQQHSSALEFELPLETYLGHDEMPAVAQDLFFRELHFLFRQRVGRNCHGLSPLFDHSIGLPASQAPGDGWHDADRVPILGGRILFVEEAYVLIVQIHIHKAANFSLFGVEVLAEFGEGPRQAAQRLAHCSGAAFDTRLLSCELAERRRNQDLYGHTVISPLIEHPSLTPYLDSVSDALIAAEVSRASLSCLSNLA